MISGSKKHMEKRLCIISHPKFLRTNNWRVLGDFCSHGIGAKVHQIHLDNVVRLFSLA